MSQQELGLEAKTNNNVGEYKFEPIKGYPMLSWRGKRPFTSTQFYPAQKKEVYGEEVNGWLNKVFWGDNLQVMSHLLKEYRGKVDLVYIDPPFDSKAEYKKRITLKGKTSSSDTTVFEEKQYADIWSNDEYLQFMYERLVLIKEMMSEKGSILLHCDWHKAHQLRCMLDEIFGQSAFVNEIIWHYRKWTVKSRNFQRNHDTIYWYSKSKASERTFNMVEVQEASEGTLKRWKGMKQKAVFDEEGNRLATSVDEESTGAPLADVWQISIINPAAKERLDYPTQKPEQLIERIINHCSNEGELVFDCFMGSGTTQAVAMKTGRRFIGADINLGAIQTTTKRLVSVAKELNQQAIDGTDVKYTGFEVYNVNNYDVFRNPVEAKELLLDALEIQNLEMNSVYDGEKDGRMVKVMPVNRIATRADLTELIAGFDYKAFEARKMEKPNQPVEKILLVCMGHEPDLRAHLQKEVPFTLDVEIVDILRDKANLEFKRDSEAKVVIKGGSLVIEKFYPMNLLQKLSMQRETVTDWKELVESVMVDWNYDGAILQPSVVDIPSKKEMVIGRYKVPADAGTIRVKVTDLLSESLELEIANG